MYHPSKTAHVVGILAWTSREHNTALMVSGWLFTNDAGHIEITRQRSEDRAVKIGGQGKDSNLRYDLRRIAALASWCLKPLSHLSSNSYLTQPVPRFGHGPSPRIYHSAVPALT